MREVGENEGFSIFALIMGSYNFRKHLWHDDTNLLNNFPYQHHESYALDRALGRLLWRSLIDSAISPWGTKVKSSNKLKSFYRKFFLTKVVGDDK
jgi:hypothetical protein